MRKLKRSALSLLLTVILLMAMCVGVRAEGPLTPSVDLAGKKIGVASGSIFDTVAKKFFPDAQVEYINANADLAVALDAGKLDAYLSDEPVARLMCGLYESQSIVCVLEDTTYGFMFPKGDEFHAELVRQFNEFLSQCWADGTMAEIDSIWFGTDDSRKKVDLDSLTAENGVLEMGISSDVGAPFTYIDSGRIIGYDVDVAARFCRAYGYGLHISDFNIAGLLAATSTSKVDMVSAGICITPERQETSLMSAPYYVGGIVLAMRTDSASADSGSTSPTSVWGSFERTFLREGRWKMFLHGLDTTFRITLLSVVFGTVLGFLLYLVSRRAGTLFHRVLRVLSNVLGKTPVVVILMIFYYIIFGKVNISNTWVSIISFTLLFTFTFVDLLQMGAEAVEYGQTEAALALGYTDGQAYRRIVFPQSIRHFLPAYKNEVVSLIKGTAVVGYIAVQDLTKISDIIRARTYEAFFPLIASAVIYFLLAVLLTRLIQRLDFLTDPRNRRAEKILKGVKTK